MGDSFARIVATSVSGRFMYTQMAIKQTIAAPTCITFPGYASPAGSKLKRTQNQRAVLKPLTGIIFDLQSELWVPFFAILRAKPPGAYLLCPATSKTGSSHCGIGGGRYPTCRSEDQRKIMANE